MKEIKALQYTSPGNMEFIEIDDSAPKLNEVKIKLKTSSLCNFCELHSFNGNLTADSGYGSKYPMQPGEPGHEGVGVIVELGKDVNDFCIGDNVVLTGLGGPPVFRSLLNRKTETIAKIIPGIRDIKAASILEMFGCAYHCIKVGWREPKGFDNARVAIIGLGAIGFCSLQIAKLLPLREIVTYDINSDKLSLAGKMGATQTHMSPLSFDKTVDDGPFDFVFECSGHPNGSRLANSLKSKVIINISCCFSPFEVNQSLWFNRKTTIYNPGILINDDLKSVANLYNRNLIDPESLISLKIPATVEAYREAVQQIKEGKIIKALMDWEM